MNRQVGERLSDAVAVAFRALLPSPLAIAAGLTILTFLLAFFLARPADSGAMEHLGKLQSYWEQGLWNKPMLAFAVQTMLMLVLGHVLALTAPVSRIIDFFTQKTCDTTARAAFTVTLLTVMVGLFNWGLGLIFGAIFARKVGENALQRGLSLNYPLIGAAGYSGLLVWHGGISGISSAKAAEAGHLRSLVSDPAMADTQPQSLGYDLTIFGEMNLFVTAGLILLLPLVMYLAGRGLKSDGLSGVSALRIQPMNDSPPRGAERIDHAWWVGAAFGALVLWVAVSKALHHPRLAQMGFIDPDWINLLLLAIGLVLHRSFHRFGRAVEEAIGGAAGILVQFPLYFGIMGLMTHSGLIEDISRFFVSIGTPTTYPIYTFLSAGLVNIFVPSGGGQWAIQGPIIVQSAEAAGVSLPKAIMALSYGDQLTNMLQPFWALPLLGITGLKARQILPYTLLLMLAGGLVFLLGLVFF
jgi:short-chain fatty acids transporter